MLRDYLLMIYLLVRNTYAGRCVKIFSLTSLLLLISSLNVMMAQSSVKKTPNIIFILTDDQGIGDVGYEHNPFILTPHIDSLAAAAVKLDHFYVCPVCAPTRAMLMTGRYSIKTGVHDTYNGGAIMDSREITMAEYLKEKKYATAIFGKWHLGDNYPFRPGDQGFDESLVLNGGGLAQPGDIENYARKDSAYFDPVLYKNNRPVKTCGYCSDVFTDAAISFIRRHKKNPFFVYLAFNAPHAPLQVPQHYYDLYRNLDKQIQENHASKEFILPEMNGQSMEAAKRVYGMVTNIDDNIGRLMAALQKNGLLDNTMIIFMSDNGPAQYRFRLGLKGKKASVYEGGIRVPCFIYYKDFKTNDIPETLAGIDLLPTLLDLLKIPERTIPVDGISFLPLLRGHQADSIIQILRHRPLFFYWQRGYPEAYRNITVREGDYKLVGHTGASSKPEDFELYNVRDDSQEKNNLLFSHHVIAQKLKNTFDKWLRDALQSPHLCTQRMILGSENEPYVVLNRNDAKGVPALWLQQNVYGYWDVHVARSGYYHIESNFLSDFRNVGSFVVRLAPYQATIDNKDTTIRALSVDSLFIRSGDYRLESWYEQAGHGPVFPFYLTVQREEHYMQNKKIVWIEKRSNENVAVK